MGIEIGKALDLDQASSHRAARRLLMVCAFCQAPRLGTGLLIVRRARRADGRWPTYAGYPGRSWFRLEEPGASRWNTVRVLRVLQWWEAVG